MGDGDRKPSVTSTISSTISDQELIGVNSRAVCFRRRTKRELKLLLILAILVLLLLIVIALLIIVSESYRYLKEPPKICTSQECVETAARYLKSIDPTANPCEDFYQYSCGGFLKEQHIDDTKYSVSWHSIVQDEIDRHILDSLKQEDTDDDPLVVTKARLMYRTCVNKSALDYRSINPMMKILKSLQLPPPSPKPTEDVEDFNLTKTIAVAKRDYGIDLIVKVVFGYIPDNRTQRILMLLLTDNKSPLPWISPEEEILSWSHVDRKSPTPKSMTTSMDSMLSEKLQEEDIQDKYTKYIADIMSYVYNKEVGTFTTAKHFENVASAVRNLDTELRKFSKKDFNTSDANYYDINNLQHLWDSSTEDKKHIQVDWRMFFKIIFHSTEEFNETIYFESPEPIPAIASILGKVDSIVLRNYLWWKVASILISHSDKNLRDIQDSFILSVFPNYRHPSRTRYCRASVTKMLPNVVSYFFVDNKTFFEKKRKVKAVMSNTIDSFIHLVNNLDWMDEETKEACREKVKNMVVSIGFPDYLLDWYTLDQTFIGMRVEGKSLLDDMMSVVKFKTRRLLQSLHQPMERAGWDDEYGVPIVANAFHYQDANAIVLPIGILRKPFFDLGLDVLYYGSLASLLGHELTHGFDNTGRLYDKEGNMRDWWSNDTVREYEERVKCFTNQYNEYYIKELNRTVNGTLTLSENIADNGGLRQGWTAHKRHQAIHGTEPRLPGLEKYNNDQMFFLAYSIRQCETNNVKGLEYRLADKHSPAHERVIGTLTNLPQFAEVWGCKKGSTMNPVRERCILW